MSKLKSNKYLHSDWPSNISCTNVDGKKFVTDNKGVHFMGHTKQPKKYINYLWILSYDKYTFFYNSLRLK